MEDVPDLQNVQKLDANKLSKNELDLATTLVQQMATTLSEIDTQDNYFNALRTLVDSKIKGGAAAEFEQVEEVPRLDLISALKQSLQASGRKDQKPAVAPDSPTLTLLPSTRVEARKKKTA
jgi:non-homologous end joining protein Ku